jgi:hypothetical protein
MFTGNEQDYFERLLDERFQHVHTKLDQQIQLQKVANGRTSKLESKVEELEMKYAKSSGHWSGINKMILIFLTIVGIVAGSVATMLWH